mmetsp:Transcript_327/g.668  ORF Transcript_327/g.668 Transcript_327/m.668 type:complete len:308 (-) Transcript_327:52-975(-)
MQDSPSFLGQKWFKSYKEALDLDSWGQIEEARDSYEKLARAMTVELNNTQSLKWASHDQDVSEKLAISLRLRCMSLKRGDEDGISLDNMKILVDNFEALFQDLPKKKRFPFEFSGVPTEDYQKASSGIMRPQLKIGTSAPGYAAPEVAQTIREQTVSTVPTVPTPVAPAPLPLPPAVQQPARRGATQISIVVDKIGFKDETHFVDPRITISVVSGGRVMDGAIDARSVSDGTAIRFEDKHLLFGSSVVLKQSYENILPGKKLLCWIDFAYLGTWHAQVLPFSLNLSTTRSTSTNTAPNVGHFWNERT